MNKLRPTSLQDVVGQNGIKKLLNIEILASKTTNEAIPHCLFSGPPGLGKTTLASIIAKERGVKFYETNAADIKRPKDIMPLLLNMEENDIIFIDEIHCLPPRMQEFLYPVIEDFKMHLKIGRGEAIAVTRQIQPFTLIGATTNAGGILQPLYDRIPLKFVLKPYSIDEMVDIITGNAEKLGLAINDKCSRLIANRSRATPRIANNLLGRVKSYLIANKMTSASASTVTIALNNTGIDKYGLNDTDRVYIKALYHYGTAGIKTLSGTMFIDENTLLNHVEPYLLKLGFITKTQSGRELTGRGYKYYQELSSEQKNAQTKS